MKTLLNKLKPNNIKTRTMDRDLFGSIGTDKVTGFSGTVTGIASYLTGCDQVLIVPRVKEGENSYPNGNWFDINRLIFSESENPITIETSVDKGCDTVAPNY